MQQKPSTNGTLNTLKFFLPMRQPVLVHREFNFFLKRQSFQNIKKNFFKQFHHAPLLVYFVLFCIEMICVPEVSIGSGFRTLGGCCPVFLNEKKFIEIKIK
jgi:hypothetical protein